MKADTMIDFDMPEPVDIISDNDEMYDDNRDHYFSVGRSALKNILFAMNIAGLKNCEKVLDIPCGHGRVLRYVKAKFPDADITACDINRDAVDFCSRTFKAKGVYSQKNIQKVPISDTFDLIWCGSLLTHLDKDSWESFITFFSDHLNEGGVLLFTTHGRLSVKWLYQKHYSYGLNENNISRILSSYENTGFGYADYPNNSEYGISISSPSWVLAEVQRNLHLKIVSFVEEGWDNHQDVIACVRVSEKYPLESRISSPSLAARIMKYCGFGR